MGFTVGKQTKESHSPLLSLWQGSQMLDITVIIILIILYGNTGNSNASEAWLALLVEKEQKKN